MSQERVTIIISDLHVGGGTMDPGDDHIYQNSQLVSFIRSQATTPEGKAGRLELFFNGDFLEFAQTNQSAFSHESDEFWCTESESLDKLETILNGHPDIFSELGNFMKAGNVVTIAAGNHDVDLFWPHVQQRLHEVVGSDLCFELGKVWVERYRGLLQIAHGHMSDVANRFEHWDNPIRKIGSGALRLEMCPGTLFMVRFVNKLEQKYPFADNLLPVTKLASVLLHDDKCGFASVGWMFSVFFMTTSIGTLGAKSDEDYGRRLLDRVRTEHSFIKQLTLALEKQGLTEKYARITSGQVTKKDLAELMFELLGKIDIADWQSLFDLPRTNVTLGSNDITLSAVVQANFDDGKKKLVNVAQQRIDETGAIVVVMGHTHQPDRKQLKGGVYYNPGCWTRYLELKAGQKVTLDDLKDESRYPYELNAVRVEMENSGHLKSEMFCFERG